jgi:hypothetical protein
VLIVGVLATSVLDGPAEMDSYRVLDDQTLTVVAVAGRTAWVRVTDVTETPATVTILVSNLGLQLGAGTAEGLAYPLVVRLRAPLADRTVIDGHTGLPIVERPCPSLPDTAFGCP